ncbi:MAG: class I SAM-dependent methyltransferase [Bacteroidota bacterium]
MNPQELSQLLGRMDVYLLDQMLKGNIDLSQPILDAGCGGGRNTVYFMRMKAEVYGIDQNSEAIEAIRQLAQHLDYPHLDRFSVRSIYQTSFPDAFFGTVICNAVLHFCSDKTYFDKAVRECWRILQPEGILFIRTASLEGMEGKVKPIRNKQGWYALPDGTERFLVDTKELVALSEQLEGNLYQPLRSVLLHEMRSMCTWCLQKRP